MSRWISLFAFLLCVPLAPAAFGDTLFVSCTPTLTLSGLDLFDTCPAASLPEGSDVTAIKLYLLADFQGGAEGIGDLIHVIFQPLWNDPNAHSGSCNLENVNGGTAAATNTCGFFSGDVNGPGTKFLTAGGDLNAIATNPFQVQVGRSDLAGAADVVTAGNIVEFDFTPAVVATPEPGGLVVVAIGLVGIVAMRRRYFPSAAAFAAAFRSSARAALRRLCIA